MRTIARSPKTSRPDRRSQTDVVKKCFGSTAVSSSCSRVYCLSVAHVGHRIDFDYSLPIASSEKLRERIPPRCQCSRASVTAHELDLFSPDDGYFEYSALATNRAESWKTLLRDLKRRGMAAPVVAVGDGALGFWAAARWASGPRRARSGPRRANRPAAFKRGMAPACFYGCAAMVLIVDDDRLLREALSDFLDLKGPTVHCTANEREAIEWFKGRQTFPGLIFLDLVMPVLDGWGFLAALEA